MSRNLADPRSARLAQLDCGTIDAEVGRTPATAVKEVHAPGLEAVCESTTHVTTEHSTESRPAKDLAGPLYSASVSWHR